MSSVDNGKDDCGVTVAFVAVADALVKSFAATWNGVVRSLAYDDAHGALQVLDPQIVVADADRGPAHALRETVAATVTILLARDPGAVAVDADVAAVLPTSIDAQALREVCRMAWRCATSQHALRNLERDYERLRAVDVDDELPDDGDTALERYDGIRSRSDAMRPVLELLRRIEGRDTTVLVHGETGTGKELVAQAIHARSARARGRFIAVNLGAISDHLRESELFGHVKGAFTGATDARAGLFAAANGGSIFLDEVGDASPGLQVALLRVLETGTITPVGADRPRRVDVRVISGTNRDLAALVERGEFRRDLFYRLHVFPVALPPLRERPEDIFPLANHFLAAASRRIGKRVPGISREARAVLEAYRWEGNVRELRNVMERAAILCKGGLVTANDLPVVAPSARERETAEATIIIPPGGAPLAALEREIFLRTLAMTDGNQRRAAALLGLRESTFRFRLRKLNIAVGGRGERAADPGLRATA